MSILLVILTVTCWASYESIDKKAMLGVNSYSYGVYKIAFEVITLPLLLWYGFKSGLLQWNLKSFGLAALSCTLTTAADFSMLYLLSKNNISWVMAMTQPISLTLAIIVGIIAFRESLSITQILAIILILVGVFLFNPICFLINI